jgi:hypothetical protein
MSQEADRTARQQNAKVGFWLFYFGESERQSHEPYGAIPPIHSLKCNTIVLVAKYPNPGLIDYVSFFLVRQLPWQALTR